VPEGSAARQAHKWLNDKKYEHVLEYVDELLADDAAQRKIDFDILRQGIRSRLTVDQSEYYDENGKPRSPTELPQEYSQHIQRFTYSEFETLNSEGDVVQSGVNCTVALTSKTKSQELLGRHCGFFSRESIKDQFDDYLQADQELEGTLTQIEDEWEDEDDGETADETSPDNLDE